RSHCTAHAVSHVSFGAGNVGCEPRSRTTGSRATQEAIRLPTRVPRNPRETQDGFRGIQWGRIRTWRGHRGLLGLDPPMPTPNRRAPLGLALLLAASASSCSNGSLDATGNVTSALGARDLGEWSPPTLFKPPDVTATVVAIDTALLPNGKV